MDTDNHTSLITFYRKDVLPDTRVNGVKAMQILSEKNAIQTLTDVTLVCSFPRQGAAVTQL